MANFSPTTGDSGGGSKKIITIAIVVILALGLGYYLFKISGGQSTNGTDNFNLDNVEQSEKPVEMQADDHVLGNREAKNTIVAYEDIQCPACKNYEPTLKAFPTSLADTKVIFRHFPLVNAHKNATAAAYASEAASAQGKFWEWVGLAYERQSAWEGQGNPTEIFVEIARVAGVPDLEKFKSDVENKTFRDRVQRDVREGYALNVGGTPTLFYNGVLLQLTGLDGIKQQAEAISKK